MISLLNAPTSTAKCMHLCVCVFMPRATNSLLTITRNGGCVRVYSSSGRNLGAGGRLFSLYTSLDVQIHNSAPLCGNPTGAWRRHPAYETVIIALRLHVDESVLLADVFFLTLMLLFFSLSPSLLSTRLRPPPCAGGSGKPGEGPCSFTEMNNVAFG